MINGKTATLRLIELAEHLTPSGTIGEGTVARFHDLAAAARAELPADVFTIRCSEPLCCNWTNLERGRCAVHRVNDNG